MEALPIHPQGKTPWCSSCKLPLKAVKMDPENQSSVAFQFVVCSSKVILTQSCVWSLLCAETEKPLVCVLFVCVLAVYCVYRNCIVPSKTFPPQREREGGGCVFA